VKQTLGDYRGSIDAFNRTRPDMDGVRAYNHQMIDILGDLRRLRGKTVLDIGASPHGYALEHALRNGVRRYIGIGLGVAEEIEVSDSGCTAVLLNMNAEQLALDPQSVDLVITLSTFEHFFDGAKVLQEMHRVLKPGGSALISFQPVWTCSEGHHLHHIAEVTKLLPPWSHLILTEDQLRESLARNWPASAPMSLEETLHWIYRSGEMNRVDIVTLRRMFENCQLEIEWMQPLQDDDAGNKKIIARYLSRLLPYSADELMIRGYSLLLNKR
jgi:SAM-dependent methyltransferase